MYSNKTYFWYWLFSFYLQVFLDHRPRDEVRQLVSARTNGATPLVLSCRNGHKDVVEYLVERCNADVEQAGTCLSLQNNCQFAMDHKNKTFKNIISWWQLSVFSTLRLLKPITVNLDTSRLLCGSFFPKCHCLGLKHFCCCTLAMLWPQRHFEVNIISLETYFFKEF